jgi:hypothetical protein
MELLLPDAKKLRKGSKNLILQKYCTVGIKTVKVSAIVLSDNRERNAQKDSCSPTYQPYSSSEKGTVFFPMSQIDHQYMIEPEGESLYSGGLQK